MSQINRLQLYQFRNYPALDLQSDARIMVLAGENGAGKTNLLEAVSLLVPGRGLRRASAEDISRRDGSSGYAISADVLGAQGEVRLGIGIEKKTAEDGFERRIRLDGETQPSSSVFADHLRMLWLTPDQDGLFRGPAGDRRRFLDRLVLAIDPSHATRSGQFEKILRDRNRLLEDPLADSVWLSAIEREAASLAVAIAAARSETVGRLRQLIDAAEPDPVFPRAVIALEGELEGQIGRAPAGEIEELYRKALRDNRARDRAAGRTLIGPQASDLAVRHAAKDMPAGLSSTGEQKALLIGLMLAQAELVADMTGMAPILLLDEAVAHLDGRRRKALFERLSGLPGQVWLTGTDTALFDGLNRAAIVCIVENGGVRRSGPPS